MITLFLLIAQFKLATFLPQSTSTAALHSALQEQPPVCMRPSSNRIRIGYGRLRPTLYYFSFVAWLFLIFNNNNRWSTLPGLCEWPSLNWRGTNSNYGKREMTFIDTGQGNAPTEDKEKDPDMRLYVYQLSINWISRSEYSLKCVYQ